MSKAPTLTSVSSGYLSTQQINANFTAIINSWANNLSLDGSSPNTMSANIDMNTNRIVNLVAGVNPTDAVNYSQVSGLIGANTAAAAAAVSAAAALVSQTSSAANATIAANAAGGLTAVANRWLYSVSPNMSDPGTGVLHFNNTTISSSTQLAISALTNDTGNPNLRNYINTWANSTHSIRGTLIFRKSGAPATFAVFSITGSISDNTTWQQIPVTYVTGSGGFTDQDPFYVEFTMAGNDGAAGSGSGDMLKANNLSELANFATARTNLGVAIGTNVQAYNSNLTTWAGITAPSGTVIGNTDTQTLTNKTIVAGSNTISGITEAMITTADNTTLNVSTSKHGLVPKATNTGTQFLRDDATWATPAGGSVPATTTTVSSTAANYTTPTLDFVTYAGYELWWEGMSPTSNADLYLTYSADGSTYSKSELFLSMAAGSTTLSWQNVNGAVANVKINGGTNITANTATHGFLKIVCPDTGVNLRYTISGAINTQTAAQSTTGIIGILGVNNPVTVVNLRLTPSAGNLNGTFVLIPIKR